MRILFTIPHFYAPDARGKHGSRRPDAGHRLRALGACLHALHGLFGRPQAILFHADRAAYLANQEHSHSIDVVICTTQQRHLLGQLSVPLGCYRHHPAKAEPPLLGFECHAVLRDALGSYDYYCYLEDDLILRDPWFFVKLRWFDQHAGAMKLLLPNRYETSLNGVAHKAYIDGDLASGVTAPFQNVLEEPAVKALVLGREVTFHRPLNPHSGCFFLSAEQMAHWSRQPHFGLPDTSFVGPLESAATLGIMRAFQVYKASPEQASFLEVQHYGGAYIGLIGRKVAWRGVQQPGGPSHFNKADGSDSHPAGLTTPPGTDDRDAFQNG